MANVFKGSLDGRGLRVGVVVARFNSVVTERLLRGALGALTTCGVAENDIDVAHVPGAVELPLLAESLARSGKYGALVCLGAIVRGETQHHDYISRAVVDSLQELQIRHHVPIALGVLTTENLEQALARSAADAGNKGHEAAVTAVEVADLLRQLG